MEIIDVFAVYGDFGNFGSGTLIGIFDNIEQAKKTSKGRGSLDCGGDAEIQERRAIKDGSDLYLLELNFPVSVNAELCPDPRHQHESYRIIITEINDTIEFMQCFRKKTNLSLRETRKFMDLFNKYGKAQVPKNPLSFDGTYSKEAAMSWKQEMELNNVAKLEFK